MKPIPVEVRIRRRGGSFRLQLGIATTKATLAALSAERDLIRRLAARGEWDAGGSGTVVVGCTMRSVGRGTQDYAAHPAGPVGARATASDRTPTTRSGGRLFYLEG